MASLNLCTLEAVKYKQITLAWNNFNSAEWRFCNKDERMC
jgi:hypothetical protein